MDAPTSGKVLLEGQDLYALPDAALARLRRTRLGFVFQAFHLLPEYTMRDNILLPLLLDKREPDEEYLALLTRQLGLTAAAAPAHPAFRRAATARRHCPGTDHPPCGRAGRRAYRQPDHQNSVEVFRLLREGQPHSSTRPLCMSPTTGLAAQADPVLRMQDGRIEEA